MTSEEVAIAVKNAVADATTQTALTLHIAECVKDKAEIKASLAKQDEERKQMHEQNRERFEKINRAVYIATGIAMCISFLLSNTGRELLFKLIPINP